MNWKKVKNQKIANNMMREHSESQKFNFTPKISKKSKELAKKRRFSSRKKKVEDRLFEISKKKLTNNPPRRSTSFAHMKRTSTKVVTDDKIEKKEEINLSFARSTNVVKKRAKKPLQKKSSKSRVREINKSVSSTIFLQECEDRENKVKNKRKKIE